MTRSESKGPDVRQLLDLVVPVINQYEGSDRLLMTAVAERIAATRYRDWAEQVDDADDRKALLACAEREEEIASRVEALRDDAAEFQASLRADHPELPDLYRSAFAALSLVDQWRLQCQAERAGAAAWHAFAKDFSDDSITTVLESCSPLEDQSADCLDALTAKYDG